MTRTQAIDGGALLGGVLAALVLFAVFQLGGGPDESAAADAAGATTEAVPDVEASAGGDAEAGPRITSTRSASELT